MVDEKIPGHRGEGRLLRLRNPLTEKPVEIGFKILEKKVSTFAGKNPNDIFLAVSEMKENVGDNIRGGAILYSRVLNAHRYPMLLGTLKTASAYTH